MAYPRHRALRGAGTPREQRVGRRLISPIVAGLSNVLAFAHLQPGLAERPIHPLKGFRQECHRPPQRTIAPDRGTEGLVRRGGCGSAAEHGIGVHCTAADGSVCSRYVEFKRPHLLSDRQSGFFCGHDRGHQPNPRAAGPLRRHGGRFRCQADAGRLLGRPDRSDGGAGRPGGQAQAGLPAGAFSFTLSLNTDQYADHQAAGKQFSYTFTGMNAAAVPEPGSVVLMLAGLGALALLRRRRGPPEPHA